MSGLFDASLVQSLMPTLPNVFTMTLRNKTDTGGNSEATGPTADGFAAAQTVKVRRRPATQDEMVRAGVFSAPEIIVHSVLNDGSVAGFVPPTPEAEITDEAGVKWTVRTIKATALETIFSCVCVRQWS